MRRRAPTLFLAFAAALFPLPAGAAEGAAGLFDAAEAMEATLDLPLRQLSRGRRSDEPLDGTFSFEHGGAVHTLDVKVSPRGNSRLKICDLPPLKLDFRRKQLEGSIFQGQNKLKLVTHCKASAGYERYLAHEFALYQSYAALTEAAFRVRKLQLTYRDSDSGREKTHPAFLIESDREVAERLGFDEAAKPSMRNADYDPDAMTMLGLFQYLAGNTDWSLRRGPEGKSCCHNGLLLKQPSGRYLLVPYDFDQAGLINAEYARPAAGLNIRSVRQRRYRGLCTGDKRLRAAVERLNERRGLIEAEFPVEGQLARSNRRALRYIDSFYAIINDESERGKRIVAACRGSADDWD